MKVVDLRCPNCGGTLTPSGNEESTTCPFCGTRIFLDDGVQKHQFTNAEQAGYEFEKGRQRALRESQINQKKVPPVPPAHSGTSTFYGNSAYQDSNSNRNRSTYVPPKKKHYGWWILGWLCFFPIPLSILIWRTDKLKTRTKIILLIVLWVFLWAMGSTES